MKKKFLVLISLLLTGSLVACGGPGGGGGDASSGGNNQSGGNGDNSISLPNTAEEAQNKLLQLAKSQGFEITFLSNGEEDGTNNGPESMTLGYKSDVLWVVEEAAYKKVDSKIELYDYNTNSKSYEFQAEMSESEQFSLEQTLKQVTAAFYIGYEIALNPQNTLGYISSEKSVTFNGRAAKEYTYSYRGLEGAADLKLVFDNETGITLKVEGSASSSDGSFSTGTYEVTSFKTGSAVTVPTLVKNSGGQQGGEGGGQQGGGQGEQGEVSKFENKEFVYVSNQNYNIFVGSKLCLFQDGSFELSFTDGGALVVYLGNYTVNEAGTLAYLTPVKVYKAKANQYSNLTEATMWNFRYDSDDAYVLLVNASSSVTYKVTNNQPMRADIPDDPNGGAGQDDKKYVVTQAQWEAIVMGKSLVNMNSNFTARVPYLYDATGSTYTTFEFDNGKVHIVTAGSGYTTEQYYQFTSNKSGYFYAQDNYNAWVKQQTPRYLDSFNDEMGLLPVPFSSVSYSSELHCYSCREWKDENQDYYTSIRFYFENGNLMKMTYNHWSTNYQHEFSKYGSTSVTIPQEGGGNHPTQDQLDALVSNNVYVYNGALDMDQKYTDTQLNAFFAGNKVSFFADKSFEIVKNRIVNYQTGETSEHVYVAIGEYKVEEASAAKPDDNYIVLDIKKLVIDGVLEQDNINQSVRIRVTPKEDKVTILEDDYNAEIYTYYKKDASLTPTHVQYTEKPDNPPQPESKWPAEDIATKLQTLGINATLPKPSSSEDNIVSVSDEIVGETLKITMTFTSNTNALIEAYSYPGSNSGFNIDYNKSDFNNNVMVYLNSDQSVKLTVSYIADTPTLTIVVEKNQPDPYPADEIAAFFRANEINTRFPSLEMSNVGYSFLGEGLYGQLTMTPLGDNTADAIIEAAEAVLLNGGMKAFYFGEEENLFAKYYDADLNYYVSLIAQNGVAYAFITIDSEAKDNYSLSYPEQYLRDIIPAGVRDSIPSFAVDGAAYSFGETYDGYSLSISLQPGMNAERSMATILSNLANANYKLSEDESCYISSHGHIAISMRVEEDKLIVIDIQFLFEEETVTYNLFSVNDWDITAADAEIWVYVWDNKGNYDWILLYQNEDETFTLETSNVWVGCKVVRFAPESKIGWKYGPDGSVDPDVTIWNETDNIELSGQSGDVSFFLKG